MQYLCLIPPPSTCISEPAHFQAGFLGSWGSKAEQLQLDIGKDTGHLSRDQQLAWHCLTFEKEEEGCHDRLSRTRAADLMSQGSSAWRRFNTRLRPLRRITRDSSGLAPVPLLPEFSCEQYCVCVCVSEQALKSV